MYVNNEDLRQIVDKKIPVSIEGEYYTVHKSEHGWCDGCAFHNTTTNTTNCPTKAHIICNSNGMNIFKKYEK